MKSLDEIRVEAAAVWPDLDWHDASLARGAFHDVLVTATGVVARISRSRFAADAMESRLHLLRSLPRRLGPLIVPDVVDGVRRWSDSRVGALIEFVPGEPPSFDAIEAAQLSDVLSAVRSIDAALLQPGSLRAWCGGDHFARIVSDVVVPLLPHGTARQATQAVADLLKSESKAEFCVVHGDLTPFNIRWSGSAAVGLIDWDFATLGDPALDIAGILTTLGRETAAQLCDPETLERAAKHRATFPLQIACAGHLHDDERLLKTGVKNFVQRAGTGTLYWP